MPLLFLLAAIGVSVSAANTGSESTYDKFLPRAEAGDPLIQHFLGYMFFYGEGVELDYDAAHAWFHLAAEEGDFRAQRNLGVFHSRAIPRIPEKFYDPEEANVWFSVAAANPENPEHTPLAIKAYNTFLASKAGKSKLATGERHSGKSIYQGFCAGCHGFDGLASIPYVPSFAHGDRLDKSDSALAASILDGKGKMPAQGTALSSRAAAKTVAYIRKAFGRNPIEATSVSAQTASADAEQLAAGEEAYLNFCGGCHGFNGIAWYVNSPSFALRERMDKTDEELKNSIKNGFGVMPAWEHMLRPAHIDALVQYIRTLAPRYDKGIIDELRRPEQYLRFRP
ncbi:MAG: c-type cytochrome [Gammaproteobacteria bacterium]|nr:c-type cytochrome [Gammaproteobacteria bacterium]